MARTPKAKLTRKQADEFLRRYNLSCAFGSPNPVEIDGVTIDLSCDLDTDLWRPIAPLGTYSYYGIRFGPRIAFPWTPADLVERWRAEGKLVEAAVGSHIKIATIQSMPLRSTFGELDLAEHRERKLAYLWVFPPHGDLKLAEPPLQLVAETATAVQIELENYGQAYRGLVRKLERLIGCEEIEELVEEPPENWPSIPENLSVTYRRALMALHEAIKDYDEHSYVAFGYLMARAEAEQHLLELALRERQAAEYRTKGGSARRSNSRIRTEPLRDHAKRLILGHPALSLTACAKGVSALVADDPGWSMSCDPDWIAKQIRDLFDRREVAGRVEYRPRDEWVRPT